MPFDYINVLPTELLYMVFDYLDYDTRCTQSEVCQRWSEMLSNYHRPHDKHEEKCLYSTHVCPYTSIREMKGYRNVEILDCKFESDWEIECLENYFFNGDLVENLVELSIDQTLCWFKEAEMFLPNLRKLHIRFSGPLEPWDISPEELPPMRCRIVAPKLRTFHQECGAMFELLHQLSEQIETLIIDVEGKEDMLSALGNLRFVKVRSLTLSVEEGFQEADFTVELRELFGRLHHLTIWASTTVLSFIIGEAKNLQSLQIDARSIDENVLLQISKLKWLEELRLFSEGIVITGLSQPNLTKLKTDITTVASLADLPGLQSLDLNYRINADLKSFFGPVAHQLQSLRWFHSPPLDHNFLDVVCSLVNLSVLKITNVTGESSDVEELFRRLVKLRIARFDYCELTETIAPCPGNCDCYYCDDDDDDDTDEGRYTFFSSWFREPDKQRLRQFVERLSLRFVDCAIVVGDGTLREKRMKAKRVKRSEED